jgi:hypothetical protein
MITNKALSIYLESKEPVLDHDYIVSLITTSPAIFNLS